MDNILLPSSRTGALLPVLVVQVRVHEPEERAALNHSAAIVHATKVCTILHNLPDRRNFPTVAVNVNNLRLGIVKFSQRIQSEIISTFLASFLIHLKKEH